MQSRYHVPTNILHEKDFASRTQHSLRRSGRRNTLMHDKCITDWADYPHYWGAQCPGPSLHELGSVVP